MTTDGKIRVNIPEHEWKAFPIDKREQVKKILVEDYGFNIDDIINLDNEGENDGGY